MLNLPKFPIPPHIRHSLRSNGLALLRWMGVAILVGVVVGCIGGLFHVALEGAAELFGHHHWLLFCLPLAGLVIVTLYHVTGMENDQGTELVLSSVRSGEKVKLRTAPLIFVSTVLTHLTGGSAGREGAALQLGGSLSGKLGQLLRLDDRDQRVITMCGMAAGFSALFGTPMAAAVFAMEVESVGVMYYAALVPCLLGALMAQRVSELFGVTATCFPGLVCPQKEFFVVTMIIILGVLCGILSNLFCRGLRLTGRLYQHYFPNRWVRVAVGGVIVIVLSLLTGSTDYNGAGIEVISRAVAQGEAAPAAFLLKMLLTALTLNAGYKGGEIVPSFFVGATFGCIVAPFLFLPASFGAGAGMIAVFCGVTNSPMTSILLAYELFPGCDLDTLAIIIAISYMTSGYHSLYHQQKIMYSKIKAKYIDTFAGERTEE